LPIRKININKPNNLPLPSIKTLLINFTFSLILGFLGPFGSFQMPFIDRFIYWFIMFNLGFFIYHLSHKATNWLFKNKNPHPIFLFVVPSLIAAIPLSILVGFATVQVGYQFDVSIPIFIILLPQVFLLGIIIDVIMRIIHERPSKDKKTLISQTFINRLPNHLGNQLICFEMEDHYIQVHTKLGSHMLLMRMKDALVELNDYNGMQVHRSYWVCIDAIENIKKESRKAILIMSNGLEIPVSRKYLSKVKELGLQPF